MKPFLPALFLAGAAALAASPALAQDNAGSASDASASSMGEATSGGEKVNAVIVYGDDPCPKSTGDEITVCARKDESERYRIPAPFRAPNPNNPVNQSWTERAKSFETVGKFGTLSCSPVGAGGATGCLSQLIDRAYAEKAESSDVRFGKIIEEEREKRLSKIDAEAADEQARVEELEKQYEAKKAKEAAEKKATNAAGESTDAPLPKPEATPPSDGN
ncbi:hypothetical protein RXV95_01940 [Novosphingobium sp. ZN18A2]|uniref:hypothetical protein n=1 Tax=Novosphingobium sp. ZN18A2 TaxID=3079861 RepID=UPI0030D55B33